jgi:hypothetical protein
MPSGIPQFDENVSGFSRWGSMLQLSNAFSATSPERLKPEAGSLKSKA